uniref:Uncharacterized protein n=1 Tax=Myoviridae sp. ctBrv3 TaxID=2825047 RepID=A0A8S5PBF2_9CAUD|nr:MAG TPA: hypothetical protein [Myoviridae sp. ctBrv3]
MIIAKNNKCIFLSPLDNIVALIILQRSQIDIYTIIVYN